MISRRPSVVGNAPLVVSIPEHVAAADASSSPPGNRPGKPPECALLLDVLIDARSDECQIALQAFESHFDLRQLHVSIPQYGWIFGYQVRTQQIVAIPQLGLFQFGLVQL